MTNELAIVEDQLMALRSEFNQILPKALPPEKLVRTLVLSCERTPKLLRCERQSLINSAWSTACLGLQADGVTGQAFLIPFGTKAQTIVGYKGLNTIAERAGFIINGAVVREGDVFDYEIGTESFVKHKPKLAGAGRKVIGAWAQGVGPHGMRTTPVVLNIDEIMAIKAKSAGAKKNDSPWNDPGIGFAAMAEKSAKRRLARSIPQNEYQWAHAMESNVDQGRASWVDPNDGVRTYDRPSDVIDAEFERVPPETAPEDMTRPQFYLVRSDGGIEPQPDAGAWLAAFRFVLGRLTNKDRVEAFERRNAEAFMAASSGNPDMEDVIQQELAHAKQGL